MPAVVSTVCNKQSMGESMKQSDEENVMSFRRAGLFQRGARIYSGEKKDILMARKVRFTYGLPKHRRKSLAVPTT